MCYNGKETIKTIKAFETMKKLLYTLMVLPLLATLSACSDSDNDLPEVDMQVTISGGVQNQDDNKIYVEQGTPLVVESITAVPRNGKKTTIGLTTYYLNVACPRAGVSMVWVHRVCSVHR